ncbi:hypothetical protein EBU91_01355 [bacterium]|nr:hypothetical protein [bacterium]
MIDMSDFTFMIPLRLESIDRIRNIACTIQFLSTWFNTKIHIKEVDEKPKLPGVMSALKLDGSKIIYDFEEGTGAFHRTRYLNDMLAKCQTKFVANYDSDVLLPFESYLATAKTLRDNIASFVYPYDDAKDSQRRVFLDEKMLDDFMRFPTTSHLDTRFVTHSAKAGFCFFASTTAYQSCGGEMEEFISYGPEDYERIIRFGKLDYKISRIPGSVYHLEHERTKDSNIQNPHFRANEDIYQKLINMSKNDLLYYLNSMSNKRWSAKAA